MLIANGFQIQTYICLVMFFQKFSKALPIQETRRYFLTAFKFIKALSHLVDMLNYRALPTIYKPNS